MNFIAFLDGDKRENRSEQIIQIKNHLETRIDDEDEFERLICPRLCYIHGETWPELSIVQDILRAENKETLCDRWDISINDITAYLEQAIVAGKHK